MSVLSLMYRLYLELQTDTDIESTEHTESTSIDIESTEHTELKELIQEYRRIST
jgi:hypothetical protein